MRMARRGLTVIGLVLILVAIGVAIWLLLRVMGRETPPEPAAPVAPVAAPPPGVTPGGGTELASRLAIVPPLDSIAAPGDTVALRVRATTETGTTVAQAVIRFAVTAGGGRVLADSAVTNDIGLAEVRWVLGSGTGEQTVQAALAGSDAVSTSATVTTTPTGAAP